MADNINFNVSEGILASQGIVVEQHEGNSDKVIHSYFICNGQTYEIIAPVTLGGLQSMFPEIHVAGQDIDGIRALLEAVTKANCTP